MQFQDSLVGAEIVVIPAGVPRKPGMTRDDLFNTNASIVAGIAAVSGAFFNFLKTFTRRESYLILCKLSTVLSLASGHLSHAFGIPWLCFFA